MDVTPGGAVGTAATDNRVPIVLHSAERNRVDGIRKKIVLGGAAFAMCAGAFLLFSSQDAPSPREASNEAVETVREFVTGTSSQPAHSLSGGQIKLSPGEHTVMWRYDPVTQRPLVRFEAQRWNPVSDTEFYTVKPEVTIFMPRGESTTIRADEAYVTVAQTGQDRLDPRRGRLLGNVKVTIDRSTEEWRLKNPDLAAPEAHPEQLIQIDLTQARFDMDRAELTSEGAVLVQAAEARIEDVHDLTVHWNQLDNRIEVLKFARGGRLVLMRDLGFPDDFGLPGAERKAKAGPGTSLASIDPAKARLPKAMANSPQRAETISAEAAAEEIRLNKSGITVNAPAKVATATGPAEAAPLRSADEVAAELERMAADAKSAAKADAPKAVQDIEPPDEDDPLLPPKKRERIHTYKMVFENEVLVRQLAGEREAGRLTASQLEVYFDFGDRQKRMVAGPPAGRPERAAGEAAPAGDAASGAASSPVAPPSGGATSSPAEAGEEGRLVLTWNGPLELRPIHADPAEQTGERRDVIAVGAPVRIDSPQGKAQCRQLVYRNEGRLVWMSGTDEDPVVLSSADEQRLVGREVFLDQRRGLAKVDGPGEMHDPRRTKAADSAGGADGLRAADVAAAPGAVAAGDSATNTALSEKKPREPVEIRWARGVDLELGRRPVTRTNPETLMEETKEKEYLRRAWFHGSVSLRQGAERLFADEVAVTFAVPTGADGSVERIEHLNLAGDVRLERADGVISAQKLDVTMVTTAQGRNVPREVHAWGKAYTKEGQKEFFADEMHVTLSEYAGPARTAPDGTPIPPKMQIGVETLDATGNVVLLDPERNGKVSRARTLKAVFRSGNELVKATIDSGEPGVLAQARLEGIAIHGERIDVDMDAQTADVPGPGKAWMLANENFGGGRFTRPTPVRITWAGRMQLRMKQNYGVFVDRVRTHSVGPVKAGSEVFDLNCDKLTVRLGPAPPPEPRRSTPDLVDRIPVLGTLLEREESAEFTSDVTATMDRKQPTYIIAEGNAEAITRTHERAGADGSPGRLKSRIRVEGPQIVANLEREQMSVPSAGALLIEDYQFSPGKPTRLSRRPQGGPLMSAVQGEGPSQTLVTWSNSMDLFVDRGLVSFDREVDMRHFSGKQIVRKEELAEWMNVSVEQLEQLGAGRKARLTCDNLLLEFAVGGSTPESAPGQGTADIRATDLRRMIARGAIHLQEDTKSMMGEYLQYLQDTNEVRLEGSPTLEARIIDQNESSQELSMWRGPLLVWNRTTNAIEAPNANVRTSRR